MSARPGEYDPAIDLPAEFDCSVGPVPLYHKSAGGQWTRVGTAPDFAAGWSWVMSHVGRETGASWSVGEPPDGTADPFFGDC
jgi:hypothetical protein